MNHWIYWSFCLSYRWPSEEQVLRRWVLQQISLCYLWVLRCVWCLILAHKMLQMLCFVRFLKHLCICELSFCSCLFYLMLSFWAILDCRACYHSQSVKYQQCKVWVAMVGCLVELVVLLYRLLLEQNNPVFWSIMGGCYVLCFLVFSLFYF